MVNIVTHRFLECFSKLKNNGSIRSARQFALSLDTRPQNFNEVVNGRRDVTIELARRAIEIYKFNADYLFMGDLPMIKTSEEQTGFKVLTVVTDTENQERILHVPIPAQAGYAGQIIDAVMVSDLPTYSLPGYNHGTHRSFDVSGDSMDPTLEDGDKVICSFVELFNGLSSLNNNNVYVVVTQSDVLVKRVKILSDRPEEIKLISDNNFFDPYFIHNEEIKELWLVKSVLRSFKHSYLPSSRDELMDLKKTVSRQSHLLSSFQSTIENAFK